MSADPMRFAPLAAYTFNNPLADFDAGVRRVSPHNAGVCRARIALGVFVQPFDTHGDCLSPAA
ncbi:MULTISPECIES: hypothetical protein [Microvirgula]|uniref:hypothetical protein n=1 Tax=Microvirgula TaxID=57479 RepID=UPI0011BE2D3B|nr:MULTISPECIES: hypothetical protein [Microvirgula]